MKEENKLKSKMWFQIKLLTFFLVGVGFQPLLKAEAVHTQIPLKQITLLEHVDGRSEAVSSTLATAITESYYGQPITSELIQSIKIDILNAYQKRSRPIINVVTTEQDISDGELKFTIVEAHVGKILYSGNNHFNNSQLEKYVHVKPGETISESQVNKDLYLINRNPFRNTQLVYSPGDVFGETDLDFVTIDRFPLRVYAGIDNTGNDLTGNNRLFTGFNWGNLFGTDQRIAYQFTASSDFNRFLAHTVHYEAPLPWQHFLILFGGYARVRSDYSVPDAVSNRFKNHGFNLQTSLRYDVPFAARYPIVHELITGFDFKRTNNNLLFDNIPVFSKNVNLTQAMLGYNFGYENRAIRTSFEAEGFFSPGKWIGDQSKADYNSLRLNSDPTYFYLRSAASLVWFWYQNWSIQQNFRFQVATENLLPSEQYGLGGYNTVRGYEERVLNGDNAINYNFEFISPTFEKVFSRAFSKKRAFKTIKDELEFLAFFDYGWESVHEVSYEGERKNNFIFSVGPGMRYRITPYVSFKADWGFQLRNLHLGGPHQRLHFSLIAGY